MIDEILEVLSDGKWHDSFEITRKTTIKPLFHTLHFLTEYGLLDKEDINGPRWKLTVPTLEFLRKVKELEKHE